MLMTKTILTNLINKYATQMHPFEKQVIPESYRGRFNFEADKCIMCQSCAIKCPTKCITIDADAGIWHQDAMSCVHCAVCVEICPTSCITMINEYRSPFIERMSMEYKCTPRPKKKKKLIAEAPSTGTAWHGVIPAGVAPDGTLLPTDTPASAETPPKD